VAGVVDACEQVAHVGVVWAQVVQVGVVCAHVAQVCADNVAAEIRLMNRMRTNLTENRVVIQSLL
jgi:hypothetical protein